MQLRHRKDTWIGRPAHLVYGPAGVLEYQTAHESWMFGTLIAHRPACHPGCELRWDHQGDCPGGECKRMEMACHMAIWSFSPDVQHLDGCVSEAEIVAAMTAMYPELMADPEST